ncbi:MAG: hypothetical protein IPL75_07610 [Acidobacteria bacterium]|nr:hypothetical protein [Acidobacteriota bacterium]
MKSRVVVSLWAMAVFVPVLCVFAGDWLFWNVTARPGRFMGEPGVTIMQGIIAALPFVVLAAIAPARMRATTGAVTTALVSAAAIGFAVTVVVWGANYYDGYEYWKNNGKGGANIGAGMLILASPFLTGVLMTVAFRVSMTVTGRHRKERQA